MSDSGANAGLVEGKLMFALRLTTLVIGVITLFGFASLQLLGNPAVYDSLAQQVLAFALLVFVAVTAGSHVLRGRSLGHLRWGLTGAVFVAAALVTAGIPTEHRIAGAEWSYGVVGWFLLLLLMDLSVVLTALSLAGFTIGTFVDLFLIGRGYEAADLLVVTVVVLGCQFPVLALAWALRRLAATSAAAIADEERARTADAVAEQLHADRRRRYTELAGTVVPLLTDLSHGTARLDDPGVRAEYAVAAARLRRLFAELDEAADPLVHELRACLEPAERRGVAVYLGVCGEYPTPPLPVRRALTEPALRAMATTGSSARVTVLGSSSSVTVSVLTDGSREDMERTEGVRDNGPHNEVAVSRLVDGSKVWVEAIWRTS